MGADSEATAPGISPKARALRLASRPAFWATLLVAVFAWRAGAVLLAPAPQPLPVLVQLPAFQLTDQDGRACGTRELQGRVWAASFIFTRCATICPNITAKMKKLQERTLDLSPGFQLVSFSVDPGYDTPPRLAEYARDHRADTRQWSFLTGSEAAMQDAVVKGLKVAMEKQVGPDGGFEGVLHGSHLVLVDGQGRVRGYYDSDDEQVVDRLARDARLLLRTGR